jgi:hypothetical protein
MQYHKLHRKDGTITTRVVCAVCFLAFTFFWLYEFQADVITIAQHVLSDGATHYNRTIGALIVTFSLFILQLVVASVVRLTRRTHALTYFPSMLVLAFISDIDSDIDQQFTLGAWWWAAPLALIGWGCVVFVARGMPAYESDDKVSNVFFSKCIWINLIQMVFMMLLVAFLSNTNGVFHYSAHAEVALMEGDDKEALRVGSKSLETDRRLTMLRVYALSRQGLLAEKLFSYPIVGTSDDMLPMQLSPQMMPADSIWCHLGARPSQPCSAQRYYEALERDSLATTAVADYRLFGCLVDRSLDEFVALLPRYYQVADSLPLPRHYQEALVLYRHLRTNPALVYHHPVVDEDWDNLKQLEAQYPLPTERHFRVFDRYRGSYWYYYFYEK